MNICCRTLLWKYLQQHVKHLCQWQIEHKFYLFVFFSRSYVDHRVNKRKKRLHFDLVVFCYNLLLMNSNRALKCNIIQSIETSQHNRIFIYLQQKKLIHYQNRSGGNIDFPVPPWWFQCNDHSHNHTTSPFNWLCEERAVGS